MKFFPKVVKSKLRLVRFLKNKLNVAKKSLHVAKFIAKSMISSKGNACEMQNLQGTWKFPCTLQTNLHHMTKHSLPYVSLQGTLSVVLRKSILAAQRDIDISVDLH